MRHKTNRAEKIALLTKLMQGGNSQAARQQLQQVAGSGPRSSLILYDPDPTGQPLNDASPVRFDGRDMTLLDATLYAHRHGIKVLVYMPDNHRRTRPNRTADPNTPTG